MRHKLLIIFLTISSFCFAGVNDSIIFQMLFEGNLADSSGNNIQGTPSGVVVYSATHYQGDSSFYPTSGQWISNDSIELGRHFFISGWFRMSTGTSSGVNVATNYSDGSPGFNIRIEGTNNRIKVYSHDATYGFNYAYSATNVFTDLTWFHLLVEFDTNIVRFFVNGVNVGYDVNNDSIISSYYPTKLPIAVGGQRNLGGHYSQQYRYDNLQIYNFIPVQLQIDSLYNNGTTSFKLSSGESGGGSNPVMEGYTAKIPYRNGVKKKFIRNGVWVIPYRKDYVPETNPQDGLIVYFAENFNDWAIQNPIPYDTVADRWQCEMTNFVSTNRANQSIISVSGHDNVWRSQYLEGQGGAVYCFSVDPLLDEPNIEELWVESQVYLASNWYDDPTDGFTSGKWPAGGVVSGNNGTTTVDSTSGYFCKGFAAHHTWGSLYNGYNTIQSYVYEQELSKAAIGINYPIPRGSFFTVTTRVVLNTPGLANGFVETYIDGLLVHTYTGLKFRSLAQYNAGLNYIEGIILKYAFGGTAEYISQQDNVVYFDNVVAYIYGEDSPFHINGMAPTGHTIPIVSGTLVNNHYPDKIWIDRNYTAGSGTINGLTTSYRKAPWCKNTTTDYRTYTISNHSNPIRLQFTKWYDGGGGNAAEDMWVKVYSGIGTTKTLLYTYNEILRDGVPTIGTTLTIANTDCTIEYCTGKDNSYPFELNYW
jgi:hypothetical protein